MSYLRDCVHHDKNMYVLSTYMHIDLSSAHFEDIILTMLKFS